MGKISKRIKINVQNYSGKIWSKQEWETKTSYIWFRHYLEYGKGRSLEKLCQEYNKNISYKTQLAKWSSKNNWVDRVNAYDLYIIEKAREIVEKEDIEKQAKINNILLETKLNYAMAALEMSRNKTTSMEIKKKEKRSLLKLDAITRFLQINSNEDNQKKEPIEINYKVIDNDKNN